MVKILTDFSDYNSTWVCDGRQHIILSIYLSHRIHLVWNQFLQLSSKEEIYYLDIPLYVITTSRERYDSDMQQISWWRHEMEPFSALLAIYAGHSSASGEFPAQRPVTWSFDVFFDMCLHKRLRKQSWGWWFDSRPLWRHCNVKFDSLITEEAYIISMIAFLPGPPFTNMV